MAAENDPAVILISSLEALRQQFEKETDDWEYSALTIILKYLDAIGVERRLRDPFQDMWARKIDEIKLARRRADEMRGTPKPVGAVAALAFSAAAVTSLKIRHGVTVSEALTSVAASAGINRLELKQFRENLSRGGDRVPGEAPAAHDFAMSEFRGSDYGKDEILMFVRNIGKFGG